MEGITFSKPVLGRTSYRVFFGLCKCFCDALRQERFSTAVCLLQGLQRGVRELGTELEISVSTDTNGVLDRFSSSAQRVAEIAGVVCGVEDSSPQVAEPAQAVQSEAVVFVALPSQIAPTGA